MRRMCSRCRHFSAAPDDRMTAHGYGRCAYLQASQYRSRVAADCFHNPSRFEERQP